MNLFVVKCIEMLYQPFAKRWLCLVALVPMMTFQSVSVASDTVEYAKDVWPILQAHCLACHTSDEAQGGLVMETYEALMKGGDSGTAITAGAPSSSRLYLMAAGQMEPVMPPDDAERLTESQLMTLSNWIEQGAKGPEGSVAMQRTLNTPEIAPKENAVHPITSVAFSPDGMIRAVARYSHVALTSTSDDRELMQLESPPGKVNSLVFSRDGSRLLIGSGVTGLYGHAAVYNTQSGERIQVLEGHQDVIQTAIFSPDEKQVATASYDREIILWDLATGEPKQQFSGHNGAVYSLAFSPDGRVLVSGCADETVKVWDTATGKRRDTMSQPTGEVFSVLVTADGKSVVAGSADNRLRVWELVSYDREQINPLLLTRFVDESPLTHLALTPDGQHLIVVSQLGHVKVLETERWSQIAILKPLEDDASQIAVSNDGKTLWASLMNGNLVKRELSLPESTGSVQDKKLAAQQDVYLDLGALPTFVEANLAKEQNVALERDHQTPLQLGRGGEVTGSLARPEEADWYAWDTQQGEMWVIETDTTGQASSLDSLVEIRDTQGQPVLRVRLQATRDSYFTFRGKNSTQHDDFRVFAWEEMKLDEYFYAAGEVTRLWLAPRGSDSGFNVYPGRGNRWTYFGTSGAVHALGEPAYVVRPLAVDEPADTNGLPVFSLFYANDDDPAQQRGKNSYVLFRAPETGRYLVRVSDTRGQGGDGYGYRLRVRPAEPGFQPSVSGIKAPLRKGSGREVEVVVDRLDGYDGEVIFDIGPLPPGVHSSFPVRVQPGQSFALGTIWADADAKPWEGEFNPAITARAVINGRLIERRAGTAGKLSLGDRPSATLQIEADALTLPQTGSASFKIRRGQTISLLVKAQRIDGFVREISLGKELAGRNLPHGVYVDNIGLNGLLVRENESERQFFLTADQIAELGVRTFFLTGAIDGNVTSQPVQLEVLP